MNYLTNTCIIIAIPSIKIQSLISPMTRARDGVLNMVLRIIVNAPWYVTNDTLHHDLNVPYVRDEIKKSEIRPDRLDTPTY